MKYISTRDKKIKLSSAQAIKQGLSVEGGLFVPETFPEIKKEDIVKMTKLSYPERAVSDVRANGTGR